MSQNPVKEFSFLRNWSIFCFFFSFIIILIYVVAVGGIDNVEFYDTYEESDSIEKILFGFLFTITVTPTIEEFMFRGVFVKNKMVSLVAIIISVVFIALLDPVIFTYVILIPYLIVYLLLYFKNDYRKKGIFYGFFILNAFLFEILHKDSVDFGYFITYPLFLLGMGFVFMVQWLVLRYSIFYSILFHSVWNGIIVLAIFLDLQIPDETLHISGNEKVQLEWKEAPLLRSKKFTNEDKMIQYESYLIKDIFYDNSDSLSTAIKERFVQKEMDQRYNFTIKIKDTALLGNPQLMMEVYSILKAENLILEK